MRHRTAKSRLAVAASLTILLSFASLGVSGCSRGEGGGGPVVGVSLLTQQHDFYKDLEEAMRKAADDKGIRLIMTSAELDPTRQTAQVEDFLAQKVDAIVICPCDSTGVSQVIRKANDAGIPIFTADIAADGGDVVSHIASDNVQGGRLAAQAMGRFLDGRGEIVIIDHPEVASVRERVDGFLEGIREFPEIEIVDRPSAGGRRDKAYTITENMLQSRPTLKGVFGINDDSALGALRAAKDPEFVIIGYDGTPEARDAIRRGTALRADVVQYPDRIGIKTIEAIVDHLAQKPVPPVIGVEVGVIDKKSLEGGAG